MQNNKIKKLPVKLTSEQKNIKDKFPNLHWEDYSDYLMAFIDGDDYVVLEKSGNLLFGDIESSIKEEVQITVVKLKQMIKLKNFA